MLQAVLNAFRLPDLRARLFFTLGILIIFRFIAHVPVPGVNHVGLQELFRTNQLIGMLDLFTGGALATFSVAALGVYPYITSTIIIQLLMPVIPRLQELAKEGEAGRTRINQITHLLTVPLALLQAYGTATLLANQSPPLLEGFGFHQNVLATVAVLLSMTAGTMLLVWLGELITQHGVGNGVSIIIFAGIVARLPQIIGQSLIGTGNLFALGLFVLLGLITVAAIVFVYQGERRITVVYAKRVRGNRIFGGTSTHIPLRVNSAGMIPLIFAQSIMLFPGTVASYFLQAETPWIAIPARWVYDLFSGASVVYWLLYFFLVVGFTFFYTVVIFQQQNIAETLQKNGGFIQGIRPGRPTQEYLMKVLTRITWGGAIFLGIVAVLPFLGQQITGTHTLQLSSTGLLIVVGVVLDLMKQLEAQLLMRQYQGFLKRGVF